MSARTWHGGVPAPPTHIKQAMFEAGRTNDHARLGILKAQYEAWLEEQGYRQPQLGRPARADEAAR